jgi:hypothetical protein
MKNLLLAAIAACILTTIVGCSCDKQQTSTSNQSAMQTDTKDMHSTH